MPRKKVAEDWKTDERGRYRRMVGWKLVNGKRTQQPFYFGDNLDQAKARYIRVRELWSHLEVEHEKPQESFNVIPVSFDQDRGECLWNAQSLWIARELAAGRVQIVISDSPKLHPFIYFQTIHDLAKKYPMVYFVPEDDETFRDGKAFWKNAADHEMRRIPLPVPNVVPQTSGMLHEALDRYMEHIRRADLEPTPDGPLLTSYGVVKVQQAERIKQRQKDRPLSSLDYHGCQELLDYWRLRPPTQPRNGKPSTPMTKMTCENHVSELMRFFRWLHKSKDFAWRKPEDFDELETNIKDTSEERTSIEFLNVNIYNAKQLCILNQYATPLERILLLLGLNCGFKGAEQGTLRVEHLFLDKPHPHEDMLREVAKFESRPEDRFILYSRNKSKVYGEFCSGPRRLTGCDGPSNVVVESAQDRS